MLKVKLILRFGSIAVALVLLAGCRVTPEQHYQRGMKYLQKQDYKSAVLEFRNAIRGRSNYTEAYYQLGVAAMSLNARVDAKHYLQVAESLDTKKGQLGSDIALRLGEVALKERDFKEVRKRASWVLEKDPANPRARELLIFALTALSEPESASAELDRWLASDPNNESAHEIRAGLLLRSNEVESACRELEKAAAAPNPSVDVLVALGNLYQVARQPEKAEAVYNQAIQKYPGEIAPRKERAWLYARLGQRQKAEAELGEIERANPKAPGARGVLATYYLELRQWPQAIAELQRLSKDRGDVFNRHRLAAAYLLAGRLDESRRAVNDLLKENHADAQARLLSGILALTADDIDAALTEFAHVVADKPDSATGRYYLGIAHWRQFRLEEAERNVQQALALEPTLLEARLWLADHYLRSGLADSALLTLNGAPESQQNVPPVRSLRALIYLARKQNDRALAEIRALQAANPQIMPGYLAEALAQLFSQHPAQAQKSLEQALKEHPESVQPLSMLSQIWITQGHAKEAAVRIEQQIAAGAASAAHYELLGDALRNAGDLPGAKKAYQRAAELAPNAPQEAIRVAQVEMAMGNTAAARAQLQNVVSRLPKSSFAWTLLARVYETEKNYPEATKAYEKAVATDQGNALAANNLAWRLLSDNGDLARAVRFAQQARRYDPNNAGYADTLGWILYRSGNLALAYNELQQGVRLGAGSTLLYHYGVVLMESHRDKQALASFQAAVKINPKFEDAEDTLKRIDLLKDRLELAKPGK